MTGTDRISRPDWRLTLAEGAALLRPGPYLDLAPLIAAAPQGDGHAVLVLPALGCSDRYTQHVRTFLTRIGYAPFGWGLGINIGPAKRLLNGAAKRLRALAQAHGAVSIVGFSMGGLFARWLALTIPQQVRRVVTVCSPIHQPARSFWLPLGPVLGIWRGHDVHRLAEHISHPLPVPCTALYSRSDGLVNWSACLDAACGDDCINIGGPHVLIACNTQALRIIAERLARPCADITKTRAC